MRTLLLRLLIGGWVGGSLAALCTFAATTEPKPAPGTFFVAPNGDDLWKGREPAANRKKTDGPFATLPRALDAARAFKRATSGPSAPPICIYLRGGSYYLDEPVVLTPEDSGFTIAAYPNERPVLSGGRRITGWKETERTVLGKRLWAADLPEVRAGKWYFRELWVDSRRAVRARYPNEGYLKVAAVPDKAATWSQGQSRFQFRPGELQAWNTATNAELLVMSRWVESRLPIASVQEQERLVNFSKRAVFELQPGDLYYVENLFEFLDTPGEWFLDRVAGVLYYLPRPGEKLSRLEAVAPRFAQILRLEGKPESRQWIEGLQLRGLTFAHTEWCFPDGFAEAQDRPEISPAPEANVGGFAQAAIGVPCAVWAAGLHNSSFERCSFTHLGTYGLELGRGCQGNRVSACEFADLGGGGLKIGETAIRSNPDDLARANEVVNCRIHDGGRFFHSAVGIWIGQSPDNSLVHNAIFDFYYTGISVGWTWGYTTALATNTTVEFNHVHHIGKRADGDGPILSDMGGIYTLGKQPGTKIRNNLWHDIAATQYGGWGIYFDEGSSGILAESNVVFRTTHGGFHQHYGETNLVRNNIFAFARDQQIQRSRNEPHLSFTFQTNIVYFNSGVLLGGDWSNDKFTIDGNIYFDARPDANPDAFRLGPGTLAQWHARGHDQHSVLADPLFESPLANDFHLKPQSPALQRGFQPIDLSRVGPCE